MRLQAEKGLDEYAIFNPLWYKAIKRVEPDIDNIMDRVFEKFFVLFLGMGKRRIFETDWETLGR